MGPREQLFLGLGLVLVGFSFVASLIFAITNSGRGVSVRALEMPEWLMTRGPLDPVTVRDMAPILELLLRHEQINRLVTDLPGGVRTVTTSEDPALAWAIRAHVRQMQSRLAEGRPLRNADPVYREIFRHGDRITIDVVDVPGGVVVTELSDDPRVRDLIRKRAHLGESEFVRHGMKRAGRPTR